MAKVHTLLIVSLVSMFSLLGTAHTQDEITLTIFADEDSLTVYVPVEGPVSLEGVGFEVVIGEERVTTFLEQYASFRTLRFSTIPAPICFRIERDGSRRPLPQDCQDITRILTHRVADPDVFWYDENARQARTLLLVQLSAPLDFCPAGQTSCSFSFMSVQSPDPETRALATDPNSLGYKPVLSNAEWEMVNERIEGVDMALVPPGCFMMGSSEEELAFALRLCEASVGVSACQRIDFDAETPQERVCFEQPFWIDKYEVTGEVYGSNGYFTNLSGPREQITWFEAKDHCEQRDARLPTEAEWEYAARGPDSLIYPWGSEFVFRNVVYKNNSANKTSAVERNSSGASWVGAHHMSGNVWEWTNSRFLDYPYDILDGRERQDDTSVRVLRGGSWGDGDSIVRTAYRGKGAPNYKDQYTGFRCVREYEE